MVDIVVKGDGAGTQAIGTARGDGWRRIVRGERGWGVGGRRVDHRADTKS